MVAFSLELELFTLGIVFMIVPSALLGLLQLLEEIAAAIGLAVVGGLLLLLILLALFFPGLWALVVFMLIILLGF